MFLPAQLFFRTWFVLLVTTLIGKSVFAWHHYSLFSNLSFLDITGSVFWGIRFDLSISALLAFGIFSLAYLIKRLINTPLATTSFYLTLLISLLLIMLHGSDMLYYGEAGRHMGYELKEGMNSAGALFKQVIGGYLVSFVGHLLWMGLTAAYLFVFWRDRSNERNLFETGRNSITNQLELNAIVIFLIAVIAVRGGIQGLVLEPIHVQEIGNSQKATLALNGAYNAIYSVISGDQIKPVITLDATDDEVQDFIEKTQNRGIHGTPSDPLPNIVVVFLESWSAVHMQSYGGDDETTPFFDQLRSQSLTTDMMLAGGRRTTEGMFSTLCSWQNPLGKTVSQNQLQQFEYYCLPHILREHGYSSLFIQGTNANTSGTGAFATLLGFEESVGKRDYTNKVMEPNSWGYHDADIYHYALKRMDKMGKPFLIGINTNSTHDVEVPESVTAKFGSDNALNIYKSLLHVADSALGDFVEGIQQLDSERETVVILLADHAGASGRQEAFLQRRAR